jgi:hypothetical protein
MTNGQKLKLILKEPQNAYYQLINTREKYDQFKRVEKCKYKDLPKTPTTKDFITLTKTVLYDLLLTENI